MKGLEFWPGMYGFSHAIGWYLLPGTFKGAGKPAGRSPVGEGTDPQGWPIQVACPSDNTREAVTTAPAESSSVQPVVNARGVATATGPEREPS